jgi:NAD dependent epimerase/dehydratase family enzyme
VGEMADELLLNGQKVLPDRLMKGGFTFDHSDIDSALQSILSDDG